MIIKNNIYIDSYKYLHFPPCLYHIWCLNVFLVINNFVKAGRRKKLRHLLC